MLTQGVVIVDDEAVAPAKCPGPNVDGGPCRAPAELLLPSGYCFAHDPAVADQRTAARRNGGQTTRLKNRRGLDPEDLGALTTLEDAERWAARIALAAATGQLSSAQANSAMRAVREFRAAHSEGKVMERIKALEAAKKGRR